VRSHHVQRSSTDYRSIVEPRSSDVFAAKITTDGAAYSTHLPRGTGDDMQRRRARFLRHLLHYWSTIRRFPAGTTDVLNLRRHPQTFLAKLNNRPSAAYYLRRPDFRSYIGGSGTASATESRGVLAETPTLRGHDSSNFRPPRNRAGRAKTRFSSSSRPRSALSSCVASNFSWHATSAPLPSQKSHGA